MATHLRQTEQLIINQLLDRNVFTSRPSRKASQAQQKAVQALKQTVTQQHINYYLNDLLGSRPENFQENLVLLLGAQRESATAVHVLLATLKAIINLPELQGDRTDRVVLAQSVIQQVHSEVVELDEGTIHREITRLFVDRFKLLTPDAPAYLPSEADQEITEYWDVDPNFNLVAQAMVNRLRHRQETPPLTMRQRINRALLTHHYLTPQTAPQLWPELLANRAALAQQWAELDRFDLECGDGYALLLDKTRQPSQAKPTVVAIAVARAIH